MSELTSQQQNEASAMDLLKVFASYTGTKLPEYKLHELGVDVDFLETTYELSVQSNADYMTGYEPLEKLSPTGYARSDGSWEEVVGKYGLLGEYGQCLHLMYGKLWNVSESYEKRNIEIGAFVTRDGKWITWHLYSNRNLRDRKERPQDVLNVYGTIAEMCAGMAEVVNGSTFDDAYREEQATEFPLRVAQGLLRQMQKSILRREELLTKFRHDADRAQKHLSKVNMVARR